MILIEMGNRDFDDFLKINRERSVYKSLTGCLEIGAMTVSLKNSGGIYNLFER